MGWSQLSRETAVEFEEWAERHRATLGPHVEAPDGQLTEIEAPGTWVMTGWVIVTEWRLMDDADEVGAQGNEYVRVFPSPLMTDSHTSGLLHVSLYDMDD